MWYAEEFPFGVSLRDQEDLKCFPVIWGCQTGGLFEGDMVMRLGPEAAQFYSGYSNNNTTGATKALFTD